MKTSSAIINETLIAAAVDRRDIDPTVSHRPDAIRGEKSKKASSEGIIRPTFLFSFREMSPSQRRNLSAKSR